MHTASEDPLASAGRICVNILTWSFINICITEPDDKLLIDAKTKICYCVNMVELDVNIYPKNSIMWLNQGDRSRFIVAWAWI